MRVRLYFPKEKEWIHSFLERLAESKETTVSREIVEILEQTLLRERWECEHRKRLAQQYPTEDTTNAD